MKASTRPTNSPMIKPQEKISINGEGSTYVIDKKQFVGKGQYGIVYKCIRSQMVGDGKSNSEIQRCGDETDLKCESLCAKILYKKEVERQLLDREVLILKKLATLQGQYEKENANDNLVKVFEVIDKEESIYIIMEYCSSGDLKMLIDTKIKEQQLFNVQEASKIVGEIVKGYQALYKLNIIHRDIKPANILIHNGVIKIADLGMGRIIEDINLATNYTKVGTPAYAAPQLYLDNRYSNKLDVYSLGVIYYQLVYGVLPIEAQNQSQLIDRLRNLRNCPIKCPPQTSYNQPVPDAVREMIERMLLYEEKDRIGWMDLFSSQIFNLKIVHLKNRRLTLTKNSINYQQFYRVDELEQDPVIQLARNLVNLADLVKKLWNKLEKWRFTEAGKSVKSTIMICTNMAILGLRYGLIMNCVGLLYNKPEDLADKFRALFTQELKAIAERHNDERLKLLRDYVRKELDSSSLMYNEEVCKFLNKARNDKEIDSTKLSELIDSNDPRRYEDYGRLFPKYLELFPNQFEQENKNVIQKINANVQKGCQELLKQKPSDILQMTQQLV